MPSPDSRHPVLTPKCRLQTLLSLESKYILYSKPRHQVWMPSLNSILPSPDFRLKIPGTEDSGLQVQVLNSFKSRLWTSGSDSGLQVQTLDYKYRLYSSIDSKYRCWTPKSRRQVHSQDSQVWTPKCELQIP